MNLTLTNLHPSLQLPYPKWRKIVFGLEESLEKIKGVPKGFKLRELNIAWLDDDQMAEANERHLNHEGATDILTFDYGKGCAELLISLDTARKQAKQYGKSLDSELTLYVAHGLLHLAGFRDKTAPQQKRMRKAERELINL